MELKNLLGRSSRSVREAQQKLPWSDPVFSARMLREHLSQGHDRASRRVNDIDRHVTWIHETVLAEKPGRILDLGCGPGLYTYRLTQRGHDCVGIDFSPASVEYARAEAVRARLSCEYRLRDLREHDFGGDFDAAMMLYGELNTFTREEIQSLLAAVCRALKPGGQLILEVHPDTHVQAIGHEPNTWFAEEGGLFSDQPYLCLRECSWETAPDRSVEHYFVIDLETYSVDNHASTTYAYTESDYAAVLLGAGFGSLERFSSLSGHPTESETELSVIVAIRERIQH